MSWTPQQAEDYLARLEPIGWRFGIERMRRLVSLLGMPQHRFASVHVVGTNGKSAVTRITAELLEAHGVRAGAYLSPHTRRWSERVLIGGEEIAGQELAAALERVCQSAVTLERGLEPGEAVTQFEAITAAAFVALAAAGVEVGVIEAGLGGRLDATNVLPSRVTVLTSVGLEHTELLGESEEQIAAEKLAVLSGHSTLVTGRLGASVAELARGEAERLGARIVEARDLAPAVELPLEAPYLRRDFAVGLAAAEAILGRLELEPVSRVAAGLALPGRMELREGDPPTLLDAAHNPAGAAALAEALPAIAVGRPVAACLAILPGKDAAGILAELAPRLDALVATRIPAAAMTGLGRPGASIPAGELAELAVAAGVTEVEVREPPRAAIERARELARERRGLALLSGSHYLLGYA